MALSIVLYTLIIVSISIVPLSLFLLVLYTLIIVSISIVPLSLFLLVLYTYHCFY